MRKSSITILIYIVLLLLTFRNLVHGEVSIIGTVTFYTTLTLPLLFLKTGNLRLTLLSTLFTLFTADVILLHLIRPEKYLTYPERNGEHSYYTLTLRQKFEKVRPYFHSKYKMRWPYINKPNVTKHRGGTEFTYVHTYNSEGLRNVTLSVAKKKNEIRIVVLGDSFTEGVGTPADSTWTALLNVSLAQQQSDTLYSVINAGVSGSDPFFEFNLLKCRLMKYQPDVVLMAVNMSDADDVMQRGGFERFKTDSTYLIKDSPWWEPFYGASIIFRMVMQTFCHYTHQLIKSEQEERLRTESQLRLLEALKEFEKLSSYNNFKLVFVFHPVLYELKQNSFQLSDLIGSIKQTENILAINLFDEYQTYFSKNALNPDDYYWQKDLHHNSKGYQLWSSIVYEKLTEAKVVN